MMEAVFSPSAAGMLRVAQGDLPQLGSTRADLFCFPLHLGVGDISGSCLSGRRAEDLLHRYRMFPQDTACIPRDLADAQQALLRLTERAARGEPVRVWYSEAPDEYCGMCWLLCQLFRRLPAMPEIRRMPLPNLWETPGQIRAYQGWGEVCPQEVAQLLPLEKAADAAFLAKVRGEWADAQAENLPLRAFVNGSLHSVPEDFYDCFLRQQLAQAGPEFSEAELIGSVLGRYRLKIGDLWLAARIEEMIAQGQLIPLTCPEPGRPPYRRRLKQAAQ